MKAAVRTRYGSPDVVQVLEVRTPTPGEREVLVKVHATTVNRTDCGFRAAKAWIVRFFSGLTKPKATINGSEFAGVVETVGALVTATCDTQHIELVRSLGADRVIDVTAYDFTKDAQRYDVFSTPWGRARSGGASGSWNRAGSTPRRTSVRSPRTRS